LRVGSTVDKKDGGLAVH
jgi:hypothetical protein